MTNALSKGCNAAKAETLVAAGRARAQRALTGSCGGVLGQWLAIGTGPTMRHHGKGIVH